MQMISIILLSSVLFLVGCGQNGSSAKPVSPRAAQKAKPAESKVGSKTDKATGKTVDRISDKTETETETETEKSEKTSEKTESKSEVKASTAAHAITGTSKDKTATPEQKASSTTSTVKTDTTTGPSAPKAKPLADSRQVEGLSEAVQKEASANKSLSVVEIIQTKAYRDHLIPLFQKIRRIHAGTADRFEMALQEVSIEIAKDLENDNSDTEVHSQAVRMVHAILVNLATGAKSVKTQAASEKTELAYNAAQKLLVKGSVLTASSLYEQMQELDISLGDFKLDSISAMNAASDLIKVSQGTLTLTQDLGEEASADKTCVLNTHYMGVEKGLDIRVSRPNWREFEVHMNINKEAKPLTLKQSAAGADFQEVGIMSKASDESFNGLTLRYKVKTVNGKTERTVDHIVLQKFAAHGTAERTVICKISK